MAQLLEGSLQGCWVLDEQGNTTSVNAAMCRLMGRSSSEMIGHNFSDFFTGDDCRRIEAEVAKRRLGVSSGYEVTITRPDGTRRICHNDAMPVRDAQGRYLGSLGLWTDLTERLEVERELRIHAWAINSITDVVSVVDEREVYCMVNDAWCRNTGVPREKAIGQRTRDVLPSVVTPARSAMLQTCLATNTVLTTRGGVALPGLQDRQLLTTYYPYGGADAGLRRVVLVTRDFTEEQRALKATLDRESEQLALLEAFPGFIAQLDNELRYLYVNKRLAALMGVEQKDFVGRTVGEMFGPERAALIREEIDRTSQGETVVAERRYPSKNGGPDTIVQVVTAMSLDPAGGKSYHYAFGTDMTSLYRAKAAVDEARAEAERANRAKSQFLAQMSHELRTPLNAILGFAQLLDTDTRLRLASHHRSHLHEIQRGGEHLLSLINEVLELGRIESGQLMLDLTPVELPALLAECLSLMRALAQSRQVLLRPLPACDGPALRVLADRLRLKQVLLNLLGNAIKYNRVGGGVEVEWRDEGESLRISVRDSGPGIAAADQARVFEPFERLGTQGDVEGTGIGLTLSQRFMQAMGGEIGVESRLGSGSTFWLRLPHARGLPEPLAEPGADEEVGYGSIDLPGAVDSGLGPSAQDGTRPTVLYIEDNPVNLLLMEAMLARVPEVQALCVMSPLDGLKLAQRALPELVLLDLQMPEMDGFEVLRRLRDQPATAGIPVYAVSANAQPLDVERAREAGFDGYLTKPVDLAKLSAVVRGVLRRQAALASP
jgi:PAS domain S-box-containing protein